jgi:hypothetical protein
MNKILKRWNKSITFSTLFIIQVFISLFLNKFFLRLSKNKWFLNLYKIFFNLFFMI